MRSGLFALVVALSLAGCVNFADPSGKNPEVVNYVLNDRAAPAPRIPARVAAPLLLVLDTTAGGFYDTDQMVFARSPSTRGYYQFARWTERPGKRFAELMRARLDGQGAYRVAAAGGYVLGDLLLDTELIDFHHDASSEPGTMRLVLRAELIDLRQRTLLGRQTFEHTVPLARFDAAGAAAAADVAVGQALDALSAWLASLR